MQILLRAGNFSIFSISVFMFKLRESSAWFRILFSNSLLNSLQSGFCLEPSEETTFRKDSSFLGPSLSPSGVKQPLSPPCFFLYFISYRCTFLFTLTLPYEKNLIVSGLNYML